MLVPLIFYLDSLRYGRAEVGPLGWGLTVFFVMYCLLTAIGLYFRPRTEFHSPVRLRGDWADRVGRHAQALGLSRSACIRLKVTQAMDEEDRQKAQGQQVPK